MDIKESIEKQLEAGYTKVEIIAQLRSEGYTDTEIKTNLAEVSKYVKEKGGSVSAGSIIMGILFLIICIWRISRFASTGSVFAFIGIFTAIILAVMFFTRRR